MDTFLKTLIFTVLILFVFSLGGFINDGYKEGALREASYAVVTSKEVRDSRGAIRLRITLNHTVTIDTRNPAFWTNAKEGDKWVFNRATETWGPMVPDPKQ